MKYYTKEELLSNKMVEMCSEKEMIRHLDTERSYAVVFTTFKKASKLKEKYYKTFSAWFVSKKGMEYSKGYSPSIVYIDEDILPLSQKQYDNMIHSCIPSLARHNGKFKIVKSKFLMESE